MEKSISYLSRTYEDFRNEFRELTRKYYPDMLNDFQDASVGEWFIDLISALGDDLSFHTDRVFQETTINSAQERSSLLNLARTNGLKIPGKKSAMVELEFSCELPVTDIESNISKPNMVYAPIIKRGTLVSNGNVVFEVMNDVDFSEQFDEDGLSNRLIIAKYNSNGQIEKYIIKKVVLALAGESKIYKQTISSENIVPFMEIILQENNVLSVESIITKDGTNFKSDPLISDFLINEETGTSKDGTKIYRFFEVESLIDQYIFTDDITYNNEVGDSIDTYSENDCGNCREIKKGAWKQITQKFITEYIDNGQLKIIFGPSPSEKDKINIESNKSYDTQIANIMSNKFLGVLPRNGSTMFILYRVGGGSISNVAANTLTNFVYKNIQMCGDDDTNKIKDVKDSIKVTNPYPSFGGKDEPTEDEIRYLIKYNNGSQNRCVTLKDYNNRVLQMPARYGTPFRVGTIEENNKISIFLLGLDSNGNLTKILPDIMVYNIKDYLKMYKMITDFIEIKSGKIINLSFEIDLFMDKTYDKGSVVKNVIDSTYEYMNINNHQMGDEIFIGDLEKEISKLDGVISVIDIRVYNETNTDNGYSSDEVTQEVVQPSSCESIEDEEDMSNRLQIDLNSSDGVLYNETNSMFEIKNKNTDIRIRIKER